MLYTRIYEEQRATKIFLLYKKLTKTYVLAPHYLYITFLLKIETTF